MAGQLNVGQLNAVLRQVPQSQMAAFLSLLLALGLHAVPVLQSKTNPVQQAGGRTALAAQGNSFTNLAVGVETPKEAVAPQPVPQAAPAPPVQPQPAAPASSPVMKRLVAEGPAPVAQIKTVQRGVPLVPLRGEPPVEPPALNPGLEFAQPPLAEPATNAVLDVAEPVSQIEQASPVVQTTAQTMVQAPAEATAVPPVEPNEAQPPEPQSPVVTHSLRPPERPVEHPAEPPVSPEPAPAPRRAENAAVTPVATAKPRGNAAASATRGTQHSTRSTAEGLAASAAGTAQTQGNAAASNYSGLVMRRIQRAKRRADVRGVALVRFRITAGGGLAGVSIARSSGSGKLDGIALAQIRRAAPFPPPPNGARTSFTVRIKGQ